MCVWPFWHAQCKGVYLTLGSNRPVQSKKKKSTCVGTLLLPSSLFVREISGRKSPRQQQQQQQPRQKKRQRLAHARHAESPESLPTSNTDGRTRSLASGGSEREGAALSAYFQGSLWCVSCCLLVSAYP